VAAIPPLFDHQDLEAGLRDSVGDIHAGLVIIDTRNKSLGADQSEDSNDTAGHVNGVLSRVAAATGCTFITTHHIGHGAKARGRGASAWTQGVDFSFLVAGNAAVIATGHAMTVKPLKMRDDEWPDPFSFRLNKVSGLQADGKIWNTAALESTDAPIGAPEFFPVEARIFWHIQENPGCPAASIREKVKGNNGEVQEKIRRLLSHGAIKNLGQPNKHSYWVQPGWQVTAEGEVLPVPEEAPEDLLGPNQNTVPGDGEK
jgi:hypothetical protein